MEIEVQGLKGKRISEIPAIYIFDGFLSNEECDWLIENGREKLRISTVISNETGERKLSDYRKSETYFFPRQSSNVIKRIENTVAAITGFPVENGEDFQIVHYNVGGYYKAHYDYHDPQWPGTKKLVDAFGQRIATAMFYLNDVEKGGNTSFPEIGLEIQPRKGRAVIWWNCFQSGEHDPNTKHAAEEVLAGEKWALTKWIHDRPYPSYPEAAPARKPSSKSPRKKKKK